MKREEKDHKEQQIISKPPQYIAKTIYHYAWTNMQMRENKTEVFDLDKGLLKIYDSSNNEEGNIVKVLASKIKITGKWLNTKEGYFFEVFITNNSGSATTYIDTYTGLVTFELNYGFGYNSQYKYAYDKGYYLDCYASYNTSRPHRIMDIGSASIPSMFGYIDESEPRIINLMHQGLAVIEDLQKGLLTIKVSPLMRTGYKIHLEPEFILEFVRLIESRMLREEQQLVNKVDQATQTESLLFNNEDEFEVLLLADYTHLSLDTPNL